MNPFLLKEYLRYWLFQVEAHSLQSPFIYEIYTTVIKPSEKERGIDEIELIRRKHLEDTSVIKTNSYGANSTIGRGNLRSIRSIAKGGITNKKFSCLYKNLCSFQGSETIWELGTSLGINTLYLSSVRDSSITTFDGCYETLNLARKNFDNLDRKNIRIIEGNLDDTLTPELGKVRKLDCVFFDANHRYHPTMHYFESCLAKSHPGSIFIFDDIHWSAEMKKAWMEIRNNPLTRITIDLFRSGIVFFDPELPKQDYVLEF